ncbi:uncharacterized protein [Haliotis cracherodii]|uniref:uncharacterized protein n=1 Tax=Haliotis cracherodii TaxID=6455 RepID=UPI0039EC7E2A
MQWPVLSPDLNPFEHLFDEIQRQLNDVRPRPTTAAELRQALLRVWAQVPMAFINRLIHSMYRRCTAVINAHGGHTRCKLVVPFSQRLLLCFTLISTLMISFAKFHLLNMSQTTLDLQISAAKEVFVEAEAFRSAKRNLEEFGHVTICGAPGEGKTTTALILGSQYRRRGYKLAAVDRIDQFDLGSFLSLSPRVFLIIDDMFADVSQLKPFLSKLVLHLQRCNNTFEKHSLRNQQAKRRGEKKTSSVSGPAQQPTKDIRVVFTSKTYNFHDGLAQMQYEGLSLFKGQTVMDMTTQTKHRYTQEEKKAIFEKHRKLHNKCFDEDNENDTDYEDMLQCDLWDADSVFGFPLTCKLFFEFSSFSKNMMNFFKEPLLYLRLELNSLLGSKTDRSAILVLMLLCEEKLDLAMLESAGKDQVLDNMVSTVLDLFPKASCSGMYDAAKGFRGTYFTRGDTVGFAHSSIYDACACVLYDISPTLVLTHCSDNFIYERVQPQPVSETETDEHLHVIYISENYYDILTTRLAKSIKDGHFSKSVTHPILQQDKIVLQLLEKLQPDESMEENDEGRTPLMEAARTGSNECYQLLQSISNKNINDKYGKSLHYACLGGNKTIVEHVISPSNINTKGHDGITPVMTAAGKGQQTVFDLLVSKNAHLGLLDAYGNSLLHLACAGANTAIVQHVLSPYNINTRGQDGQTPVMVAAGNGHQNVFDLLVSKKADLTLVDDQGNTAIVQHVVTPSNINIRGQYGRTPVIVAACKGNRKVFDLLVSKKADLTLVDDHGNTATIQHVLSSSNINTRGQDGHTPVMVAACKGHQRVFDLLVSKKADLTLLNDHGNSLLHLACDGGNTAIAQHVVSPSNINTREQDGHTPVMVAANKGYQCVFHLLVSKKADLTLRDDHGNSLLHHACTGGNTAIVQHVLTPSNINTRGQYGRTPVMTAATRGHKRVFDLLVSKKADLTLLDDHGNSLLHLACIGVNTAIVQHLVSPSNINIRGQYGRTPVMVARCKGHQRVFDLLVSKKAHLTLADDHGNSLLHHACNGGNTAIVQHVLSPSNINTRGEGGYTPLMTAATAGHKRVFDLLVSKKADLTLVDDHGHSLPHHACIGALRGHQRVFDLLVSRNADLTQWISIVIVRFVLPIVRSRQQ